MLKFEDGFEVDENDIVVLYSGEWVRAWAYKSHCNFHSSKSDTRIKEVLRAVWRSNHD